MATQETPQQILTANLAATSNATSAKLPGVLDMRRGIRRLRQKAGNPPPLPTTRAELPNPIPRQYATTSQGENFLAWDSVDADRILVFATNAALELLNTSKHWFMDGTFLTTPPLYAQLYTIHALVDKQTVPCVYALLPNKT